MPVYEYICLDCRKVAEVRASLDEKEKGLSPACPYCQSKNTAQYFGNMKDFTNYPLH